LWPVMATILTGPRKSGRSLLGRIFAARTGGQLIDDAETRDEEAIFHAWNRAQTTRRPLLLIADTAPPAWRVALPDLASRLAASPHVAIAEPDDALLRAILEKLLAQRGLAARPDVLLWLVQRIERSYVGLLRAVDAIDEAALVRRSPLTIPLARRALATRGVIDDS
ncbi:MAG TPA: DnaA/Hda family protein, partial [Sphingomonadaceae bacterium]|nr:DnaA/Hda family protein [Sphingomonadaceae bacterium]